MQEQEIEETQDIRKGDDNRRSLLNQSAKPQFTFRRESTIKQDEVLVLSHNETTFVSSNKLNDNQSGGAFEIQILKSRSHSIEEIQNNKLLLPKEPVKVDKHVSTEPQEKVSSRHLLQRINSTQSEKKESFQFKTVEIESSQALQKNLSLAESIDVVSIHELGKKGENIQTKGKSVFVKKEEPILPLKRGQSSFAGQAPEGLLRKKNLLPMNETWKTRGLFVLFYIRKFIVYMKNISNKNKFRSMQPDQFEFINDQASDFNFYKYGNYLTHVQPTRCESFFFRLRNKIDQSKFQQQISAFLDSTLVIISPESTLKLVWDGFMLFLLMMNIFYIPLKIAFEESASLDWNYGIVFFLNDVPGWAFLMDIVMTLNTSYYKKGVIIKDRSKIVDQYIKRQLFWDLIVLVPFISSLYFEIRYLDSILLLRFNKVRNIANNYIDLMNLRSDQAAIWDLAKLIIFILFVAHFCGCAFYLVSYMQTQTGDNSNGRFSQVNWLSNFYKAEDVHSLPWISNYILSFYWAVITMITVGYGDITPTTDIERLFVIVITLLSCGVFAYSVNSIGSIISAISQKNSQFKQKMTFLSIHMKKRGLSTELQMKVKKYFEYLNEEAAEDNEEGEKLMKSLAQSVQHEIASEIYGKLLNSKKIMKLNFSQEFLRDLAPKLKERRHGPEEIIYSENEPQNKLFFCMKGNVNLYLNAKKSNSQPKTILKQASKGGVFGELSFFSGMAADHSAISQNVVSLVFINLEDFLEVIKAHPIDRQKLALIKDNFTMYSSSRGLGSQCAGCGKFSHQFNKCPIIKYIPNYDQVLERFKKEDVPQIRKEFRRWTSKEIQTWKNLHNLKQAVIELIVEREKIDDIEILSQRLDELDGFQNGEQNSDDADEDEEDCDYVNQMSFDKNDGSSIASNQGYRDREEDPVIKRRSHEYFQSSSSIGHKKDDQINKLIRRGQRRNVRINYGTGGTRTPFGQVVSPAMAAVNASAGAGVAAGSGGDDKGNFRDIRAAVKRATFIKKMSTRKSKGAHKTFEDDDHIIAQNEKKMRPVSYLSVNQQHRDSKVNLPDMNNINNNNNQLDKQQTIENEKSYSLLIEFDLPQEFSHYYPKNNPTKTIDHYNSLLKQHPKFIHFPRVNQNKFKEQLKNDIINSKRASIMRPTNLINSLAAQMKSSRPLKRSGANSNLNSPSESKGNSKFSQRQLNAQSQSQSQSHSEDSSSSHENNMQLI